MYNVYIRPLCVEDAKISFKWRNDAHVWLYTGSRPAADVTEDVEREWLTSVIKKRIREDLQ